MPAKLIRKSESLSSGPQRIDHLLGAAFPNLRNRFIDEAIENGLVLGHRGEHLKKGLKAPSLEGTDMSALKAHLESLRQGNSHLAFSILHEEPGFCVVDKPPGIAGHPLSLFETSTVTHWALARFPQLATEFPEAQPILSPHRLDTGTSGLLMVALTKRTYDLWRERFSNKEVTKVYEAWCWGRPLQDHWVCEGAIGKAKGKKARWMVGGEEAREARSVVDVVSQRADRFLARVTCTTGVTHQVRVHLSASGYPLIGDRSYDLLFESRDLQPTYHLLRAVELQWQEAVFRAPSGSFRSLYL